MKKFYSLILLAVCALIGVNANAAAIIGDSPLGGWNWDPAGGVQMTLENGIYTVTVNDVPAGKYFAITPDGATGWGDVRRPSTNGATPTGEWEETSTGSNNSWKTAAAGNYTFMYNPDNHQVKVVAADVVVADPAYYLIGTFNGWDQDTQVPFVKDGDNFKLTYTFSGEFKVRDETGSWFGGVEAMTLTEENNSVQLVDGQNLNLAGEAEYTLVIDKDGVLTVTGFGDPVEDELLGVYIIGADDELWENKVELPMEFNGSAWALEDQKIPSGFEFKVVKKMKIAGEQWIGAVSEGKFWITEEFLNSGSEISLDATDAGQNVYFEQGGTFDFFVAEDFSWLSVSGEIEPDPVYVDSYSVIIAQGGDWDNQQVQLALEPNDNGEWKLEAVSVAANSEMKVVMIPRLESDPTVEGTWTWIGAQSEGLFWVTEEQLGNNITMLVPGENLFFENEGVYNFAFNPKPADAENMVLVVTKTESAPNGDINGDGSINAGDVSSLYEAILGGNSDAKFDLNGDGSVNAGDVSALYGIILAGE